jgi:dihydrofolate synthase/folylpolyglutamate synthase
MFDTRHKRTSEYIFTCSEPVNCMIYQEALDYLYSFLDSERKLHRTPAEFNLPRTQALLDALGAPQRAFKSVIVAGTKGKGSTSAMLESILRQSGYRTGLWTSPHLHSYRERIQVDRRMISQDKLVAVVEMARPIIEQIDAETSRSLTTFEVGFGLALAYFAQQQVDIAVLEVGLGGRYDSANAVERILSVISSISYDHMHILGKTLTEIAYDKAGILKPGVPAVTIPQHPEAMEQIVRVAGEVGAPLWVADGGRGTNDERRMTNDQRPTMNDQRPTTNDGSTITDGGRASEDERRPANDDGQGMRDATRNTQFAIRTVRVTTDNGPPTTDHEQPTTDNEQLTYTGPTLTALQGVFQRENARLAVGAALVLRDVGLDISDEAIGQGLAAAQWPGRMEIVADEPPIVLDGAHNGDSAHKLMQSIGETFPNRRIVLVLGVMRDKDFDRMLPELIPAASALVLTRSRHPRALEDLEWLAERAEPFLQRSSGRIPVKLTPDIPEALIEAHTLARPGDIICVTGTIPVVAAAREALGLPNERD